MRSTAVAVAALGTMLITGCVSKGTHTKTLADLDEARRATAKTAAEFETFKKQAAAESESLRKKSTDEIATLRLETTRLSNKLQTSQAAVVQTQQALEAIRPELAGSQKTLGEAKDRLRDLEAKLTTEQALTAALREDKQQLTGQLAKLQNEITGLQKVTGQLERETAHANDLAKRLSERDQEIGRLRQMETDRAALTTKITALTDELEKTKGQVETLRQERDQLIFEVRKQREALQAQEDRLKADEARLEQKSSAEEAEIQRLTQTQADLVKSFEAEIAKGDIAIHQLRNRLTITMVDRILFDPGQTQARPAGLKALKKVGEILKGATDKLVRIEGHTDNKPIGGSLREKYPTNWELSAARAASVVRYLIDHAGVDRTMLSAVGYADTRPVAGNDTEEGLRANRRIEIVLFPKDLSETASQMKP
jgi:chemotaxis protein MotB